MADLKINDYTAASAIENTTSFIAQTVSNTTQRVPLSVIKDNIANEFMKNAELIYEGASWVSSITIDTPQAGDIFLVIYASEHDSTEDPPSPAPWTTSQTAILTYLGNYASVPVRDIVTDTITHATIHLSSTTISASSGTRLMFLYKISA